MKIANGIASKFGVAALLGMAALQTERDRSYKPKKTSTDGKHRRRRNKRNKIAKRSRTINRQRG